MDRYLRSIFFFFNDTATTEIYTLSLHDALPISRAFSANPSRVSTLYTGLSESMESTDRKSTRLNSSHGYISYAVFCLKKKKKKLHLVILSHQAVTLDKHCHLDDRTYRFMRTRDG